MVSPHAGTDHGWGGNTALFGGKIKGTRIHGQYPFHLSDELTEVNAGRGILLPTTPWEGIWQPVAEWMGVKEEDMDMVLPNRKFFPQLLHKADVYEA